ncbi:MAG: hypothetical protein NTZ60_10255 [Campylobacterales bacterium]|nr:hypothetical protein [Campylobacterales bacterium]
MILLKCVKDRVSYYKINIYPTLFGDFLIQKEYGSAHHKKPTNIIKTYAKSNKEALLLMLDIAVNKKNIGYLRAS